jgi:hypothetical protein
MDVRLAELENEMFKAGDAQIEARPGENDLVHAQVHLQRAGAEMAQVTEYLTQKGDIDPAPVLGVLGFVQRLLTHVAPHVEAMAEDLTRREAYVELRKALQQISARWESMVELAQRLQPTEEAQQEQMSKLQMKLQEHQLNMRIKMEEHQAKLMLKQSDVQNRMSLRRIQTDAKMASQMLTAG